jgi:hypothetical protein
LGDAKFIISLATLEENSGKENINFLTKMENDNASKGWRRNKRKVDNNLIGWPR